MKIIKEVTKDYLEANGGAEYAFAEECDDGIIAVYPCEGEDGTAICSTTDATVEQVNTIIAELYAEEVEAFSDLVDETAVLEILSGYNDKNDELLVLNLVKLHKQCHTYMANEIEGSHRVELFFNEHCICPPRRYVEELHKVVGGTINPRPYVAPTNKDTRSIAQKVADHKAGLCV